MSGLKKLFSGKGNEFNDRMKGLMKLTKLKTIVNYAAIGEDGLSYKHSSEDEKRIIGFPNGAYDFSTGEFRDGRPDDYLFMCAPHNYDANALPPVRFLKNLKKTFRYTEPKPRREFTKKDKDYKEKLAQYIQDHKAWYKSKKEYENSIINFLQVLFGYILIGSGKERAFVIFDGPEGSNGKTTLMNIICSLFGDYAVPIDPGILLSKKFDSASGAHTSHILDWMGRRFLFADETEAGKKIDTGFIKRITGNADQVARGAHEKELQRFKQTYTIILLTNSIPYIPAEEEATWRRVFIVPFKWSFVENPDPSKPYQVPIDKNLIEDLKEEYPAIIKWMIDGAEIYKTKQSLDAPESIRYTAANHRKESDPYVKFIDECIIFDDFHYTRARTLHNVYKAWCKDSGHVAVSEVKFSKHMERLKVESDKRSFSNIYLNVLLNPETLNDLFNGDDRPRSERYDFKYASKPCPEPKQNVNERDSVEELNRIIDKDAFAV
jgi:P4 family phage/plasmid primase-like protien